MNNTVFFQFDQEDIHGYTPRNKTDNRKHIGDIIHECQDFSRPGTPYVENNDGRLVNCTYMTPEALGNKKVYMFQERPDETPRNARFQNTRDVNKNSNPVHDYPSRPIGQRGNYINECARNRMMNQQSNIFFG